MPHVNFRKINSRIKLVTPTNWNTIAGIVVQDHHTLQALLKNMISQWRRWKGEGHTRPYLLSQGPLSYDPKNIICPGPRQTIPLHRAG